MVKIRAEGQYPGPDGHLNVLSLLCVPMCEQEPGPALKGMESGKAACAI